MNISITVEISLDNLNKQHESDVSKFIFDLLEETAYSYDRLEVRKV